MPALKTSVREFTRRIYDSLHSLDVVILRCTSGYFLFSICLSLLLASVGLHDFVDVTIGFGVLAGFYFLKASSTGMASHWEEKFRWDVVAWDWILGGVLRLIAASLLLIYCAPFPSHGLRNDVWVTIACYQGFMGLLSLGTGLGRVIGFHRFDLKFREQKKQEKALMEDLLKSLG